MKNVLVAVLAAALLCIARPSTTQLTHQDIKAEEFIKYITVASPYTEWQTWPDQDKLHRSRSPESHGPFVTTYINRTAMQSISQKKGMPNGSIIVAENYTADKKLGGLTTMYKVAGYNPEFGDWYWVEATHAGKVIRFGKVQPCIDCHAARSANDYIWTAEVGRQN